MSRGYLTYQTLSTYDPKLCTAACDKISSCQFANIYYEKDPNSENNPVDVIKCSLYSMPQTNRTATNKGEWQGNFHVLVTGSNGYNKAAVPVAPPGYSLETLPGAVNAPLWDSQGQSRFIQPVYLDYYCPSLCAAACDKQTAWDKSQSSDDCNYKTCIYANLYVLSQDGVPKTVVCALYTEATNSSYATNTGYWTDTDSYQVSNSIAITNMTAVEAGFPQYCAPLPSDISYLNSTGSDFCTSYLGYSAPTDTVTQNVTPVTSNVHDTLTVQTTLTSVYSTDIIVTTAAAQKHKRRASSKLVTTTVQLPFITVSNKETMIAYQTTVLTVSADDAATSGAIITPAAVHALAASKATTSKATTSKATTSKATKSKATSSKATTSKRTTSKAATSKAATSKAVAGNATATKVKRSAIATPLSIQWWPSQKISAACSLIATGTITTTITATASTPSISVTVTTETVTQVSSVVSTLVSTVVGSSSVTASSAAASSAAASSAAASSTAPISTPSCLATGSTQGQLSLGGYALGFLTPFSFNHDPLYWTSLGSFYDQFLYNAHNGLIFHQPSGKCLSLGPATKRTSPKYKNSPFVLDTCSCAGGVRQKWMFKSFKSGKGKQSCLAIQGDWAANKGPYFPKLVANGDGDPFSGVFAGEAFDACISFVPGGSA